MRNVKLDTVKVTFNAGFIDILSTYRLVKGNRSYTTQQLTNNKQNSMMQKYIAQQNIDETYDIARFNVISDQYEVIETGYTSESEAIERAHELNVEEHQYEHQSD